MRLHDRLADRETEAGVAGPRAGFVRAIKTFEDTGCIFRGNPLTRIRDGQNSEIPLPRESHTHFPIGFIILDGIRQEIGDDLGDAFGIASNGQRGKFGNDFDAALFREGMHQFHAIFDGAGEVEGVAL